MTNPPDWEAVGTLDVDGLAARDGVSVNDIWCSCGASGYERRELTLDPALVIVRRGAFWRRTSAGAVLVDAGFAYFAAPDVEEEFAHPHDGGDDDTAIVVSRSVLAQLDVSEEQLPLRPVVVDAPARTLLGALRRDLLGQVGDHWQELALDLFAVLLAAPRGGRPAPPRRRSRVSRRQLVDRAREALIIDTTLTVPELGRLLDCSPHHLSRVFRAETGTTISAHRVRLRARAASERIAQGESNLARLAADLGFSDHSHLTRTLVRDTGETPTAIRRFVASTAHECSSCPREPTRN
jgi:AraC-like DNA-binding protein